MTVPPRHRRQRHSKRDRRVHKTRQVLHDAFNALISEKSYDAIAVQEILDRANVGRSTFYTHYRGKDELLAEHIETLIVGDRDAAPALRVSPSERLLSFSLPLLEHIERHRHHAASALSHPTESSLHERLRLVLGERIAETFPSIRQDRAVPRVGLPQELVIQYVASTFVLVLEWWLTSGGRLTPAEVDAMFRELVRPVLVRNSDSSAVT